MRKTDFSSRHPSYQAASRLSSFSASTRVGSGPRWERQSPRACRFLCSLVSPIFDLHGASVRDLQAATSFRLKCGRGGNCELRPNRECSGGCGKPKLDSVHFLKISFDLSKISTDLSKVLFGF
jgi:hypothetical protein